MSNETDSSSHFDHYGQAKLYINDKLISDFSVVSDAMGHELAIIGSSLRQDGLKQLGTPLSFYDPGYSSVASCASDITFLKGDGERALLFYRGFPIEDLAGACSFLEVAYLLFHGDLPDHTTRDQFQADIKQHLLIDEQIATFFNGYRRDAHPMTMLHGLMAALSSFYCEVDPYDPVNREQIFQRVLAKVPTIAAMAYKYNMGKPFVAPRTDMSYTANFLNMMFSSSVDESEPNPVFVKALDTIFSLHADHEQNASTSTVRMVGSTHANPFSCLASGVAALSGPLHGGANEACLLMLEEIGDVSNIDRYIARAKDKDDPFRLMGFGHRVYRNYDPRARIMRTICHEVLAQVKGENPLFDLARKLEEIALNDPYFVSRNLYPNIDFYSGITLRAMGIPLNMFTVIFALGRMPGWYAQWSEMYAKSGSRLCRPRQIYTGSLQRNINL